MFTNNLFRVQRSFSGGDCGQVIVDGAVDAFANVDATATAVGQQIPHTLHLQLAGVALLEQIEKIERDVLQQRINAQIV